MNPWLDFEKMPTTQTIQDVLNFWFGQLDPHGSATPETTERWRMKDPAFDQEIRTRFEPLYEEIVAGNHENWLQSPEGLIAYVVVIDQLSRNMFRDTPKMYASDPQVLKVALQAIQNNRDKQALFAHRNFLYMPLMHSEELHHQNQCVALYKSWLAELQSTQKPASQQADVAKRIGFATRHRDVVAQFDRFPHRNDILGRTSTPQELEFLKLPTSWF